MRESSAYHVSGSDSRYVRLRSGTSGPDDDDRFEDRQNKHAYYMAEARGHSLITI